jgi:hypothetical protein
MRHVRPLGPGAELWACVKCSAELVALDVDVEPPDNLLAA